MDFMRSITNKINFGAISPSTGFDDTVADTDQKLDSKHSTKIIRTPADRSIDGNDIDGSRAVSSQPSKELLIDEAVLSNFDARS